VGRPRTRWADYIEDLGWNRLGLQPSELLEVVADRDVWRLNLELLPPQPSRTWAGSERKRCWDRVRLPISSNRTFSLCSSFL